MGLLGRIGAEGLCSAQSRLAAASSKLQADKTTATQALISVGRGPALGPPESRWGNRVTPAWPEPSAGGGLSSDLPGLC